MRLSRAELRRRINGDLSLRYEASGLTSFAGLELIARFLRMLDFKGLVRRMQCVLPASDFGSVPMLLLVLVMLITGALRARHVGYVEGDPLVERVCGLGRMPTQHTLGRWLRAFDDRGVKTARRQTSATMLEMIAAHWPRPQQGHDSSGPAIARAIRMRPTLAYGAIRTYRRAALTAKFLVVYFLLMILLYGMFEYLRGARHRVQLDGMIALFQFYGGAGISR